MFSAMTSRGINVFHNFNYTPAWARTGGDQRTPPSNPAKYTEYITWAVNRWKSQCHHWGFWNEVNIAPFWTGDYNWYIQNMLIPGIDAVKAADPTAKTVVGELSTVRRRCWQAAHHAARDRRRGQEGQSGHHQPSFV